MAAELHPRLIASFAAASAFDVLLAVVAVLWARRRLGVEWKVVGVGALTFTFSQILTRVPLVQLGQYLLRDSLSQSKVLLNVWLVVLSLTAGLFEETARLIAFKKPLKDYRSWRNAVGLGIGHGGLESALVVGGMTVLGLVNVLVLSRMDPSTLPLSPEQLAQVQQAQAQLAGLTWWMPLLGAYERVGAMAVQVALSVLVLQRFLRGQRRWYWFAVGFHAVVNGAAVMTMRVAGAVRAEGVVTLFGLVALWLIVHFRPRASRWGGGLTGRAAPDGAPSRA
jgi:uncharacterized membrane protein YhfC